jgi:hypothetical protein
MCGLWHQKCVCLCEKAGGIILKMVLIFCGCRSTCGLWSGAGKCVSLGTRYVCVYVKGQAG